MTYDEWDHLFNERMVTVEGVQQSPYGQGIVNGVNGVILLPDNWDGTVCSSFTYGQSEWSNEFGENTTTKWSDMEAAGCVFLPAAGVRSGIYAFNMGEMGAYWSSTAFTTDSNMPSGLAYIALFRPSGIQMGPTTKEMGLSVRLVCPAEVLP